ncbi:hypothetical protein QBC46DRAFT_398932, partial [Diplogelasinospora grovesii]
MAARAANTDAVREFLDRGLLEDIDWPGYTWGTLLQTTVESLLHKPVPPEEDATELVEFWLKRGADVDKTDEGRRKDRKGSLNSALESAACKGARRIVSMLLAKEPKLQSRDTRYGSAIAAAASGISTAPPTKLRRGRRRDFNDLMMVVDELLGTGRAHINAWGRSKKTALDVALDAQKNRLGGKYGHDMVEFLRMRGARRFGDLEPPVSESSWSGHHPEDNGLRGTGKEARSCCV